MNVELLKQILSIPSYFKEEAELREFLKNHLYENGFVCETDTKGNLYAIKGKPLEGQFYPCFVAHMDTVHFRMPVDIVEYHDFNSKRVLKPSLKAVLKDSGKRYGLGADDKAGVFEAIEVAKKFEHFKLIFFVEEEYGCHGSENVNLSFFDDVSYVVQFDGPEQMVTQICMDQVLFESKSEFGTAVVESLNHVLVDSHKFYVHPYTDVWKIKAKVDLCCVNLPAGYYNMHSHSEYVVLEDVENSINLGSLLVEKLGFEKKYEYSASISRELSRKMPRGWHSSKEPIC